MYFFLHVLIYMFLKKEKPEMEDFERKKYFGSKGKILKLFSIFKENILKQVFNVNPSP